MGMCEMCGEESNLVTAIVEGSVLSVCGRCKNFGDVIIEPKEERKQEIPRKVFVDNKNEEVIVMDYNKLIKDAREKSGMKQEELASKINEKESIIHKLESRHLKPSIQLAIKLQKALGIRLLEEYKEEGKGEIDLRDKSITIGDLIRLKKRD